MFTCQRKEADADLHFLKSLSCVRRPPSCTYFIWDVSFVNMQVTSWTQVHGIQTVKQVNILKVRAARCALYSADCSENRLLLLANILRDENFIAFINSFMFYFSHFSFCQSSYCVSKKTEKHTPNKLNKDEKQNYWFTQGLSKIYKYNNKVWAVTFYNESQLTSLFPQPLCLIQWDRV